MFSGDLVLEGDVTELESSRKSRQMKDVPAWAHIDMYIYRECLERYGPHAGKLDWHRKTPWMSWAKWPGSFRLIL